MQEVQRFNKVLKFIVLLGDVLLLNLLLWGFELIFGNRFYSGVSSSLYQGMVLLSLCYLVCNIQSGVIFPFTVIWIVLCSFAGHLNLLPSCISLFLGALS